jgi:membrane protein implicated in regulation of membrane protease activity
MGDMMLWSLWWVWLSAALALGILEVLIPGFIFLGFACGAAIVGLLLLTPLSPGLPALLTLFAVLSLLSWLALRRYFRAPGGGARLIHKDIND